MLVVQTPVACGFADLDSGHFAYYSVQNLLEEGVIDQASYFRPNDKITRAEFITMIMRARGAEDAGQNLLYAHLEKKHTYADLKDVPVGASYAGAVSWAVSENIISGKADGLFHGQDGLNRAEASKIITLAFFGGEMRAENVPYFSDVDVYAWYYPYLLTVVSEDIMRGYADNLGKSLGKFGPSNSLTRAETAVILERCLAEESTALSNDLAFNAYARSATYLQIDFSENLNADSVQADRFVIRNSQGQTLRVYSAELNGASGVVLTTASQVANEIYTITASNLEFTGGQSFGAGGVLTSFLGYSDQTGALTVALNSQSTAETTLGSNAAQIEFLDLELSAGLDNGVTIQSIDLKRRGLGKAEEIQNIRAIYGNANLAEKKYLRDDNSITLNFNPYILLQPGQTAELRILADFAKAQEGTTYHYFEVAGFGTAGEITLDMSDRLQGPQYKRVTTASALLNYTEQETGGEIELEKTTTLAQVLLQAYNEDINLTKIIFENEGTVDDNCFEDVELRIGGRRVADRLDDADDDRLIFDFSDKPYLLEKNSQEELLLKGKLSCGLGDVLALHIDDKSGISATGVKFGYGAQIVRNNASVVASERTVGGGTLTLSPSSNNPGTLLIYADGKTEKTIAAFRFVASGEDLTLEDLDFELTTSGMSNHFFEELTFYWGGKEVENFNPKNLAKQTLTVSGPLELEANRTKTLTVKAKMGKILTEEEGAFQLSWHALSDSAVLFDVEKVSDGSQLRREEVSPSGDLVITGGEIRVREDI